MVTPTTICNASRTCPPAQAEGTAGRYTGGQRLLSQPAMSERRLVFFAALNLIIAVGAGAFGSHGLRQMLTPSALEIWHIAVLYQMVHGLGLFIIAALLPRFDCRALRIAGPLMLAGIVVFSGSLYLLTLTGTRILGAITPIGGTAFLVAWGLVAWAGLRGGAR